MTDIVKRLRGYVSESWGSALRDTGEAADEIERLRAELERERMRLAACGVVALADTPESAAKARDMHDDYRSASCDDVARRVDECIHLRAEREALRSAIEQARELLRIVTAERDAMRAAASLCEKHAPRGTRGQCVICSGEKLSRALSRISYLCGEPNEMEVGSYDLHYDEDAVIAQVEALRAEYDAYVTAAMRDIAERDDVIEGLRADALRYRWLRANMIGICHLLGGSAIGTDSLTGNELDAAIDAAMAAQTPDNSEPVAV